MCLYIIHFLLAVNYDKKVVQTHFLLLFVNKKYPETYILLWKGGWFWLFTHFANKKPSASPRAFYCCKMCKKSKSPPFLYYKNVTKMCTFKTRPSPNPCSLSWQTNDMDEPKASFHHKCNTHKSRDSLTTKKAHVGHLQFILLV